jgi:hypothetical protein
MQAAQTWRHTHPGTMIAAVAVVLLLTMALVYVSFESRGESVSGSNTSALGDHAVDRATFLEQNMIQIPYTPPRVLSAEEIAFWEANTVVRPSAAYVAGPHEVAGGNEGTMAAPAADPALDWTRPVGQGEGYVGGFTEYEYGSDGSTDSSTVPVPEYTADPYNGSLTEH